MLLNGVQRGVGIREDLDVACWLFDAEGFLDVLAEEVSVHLGDAYCFSSDEELYVRCEAPVLLVKLNRGGLRPVLVSIEGI